MSGVAAALGAAIGFAVFQTVQRRALRGIDVYRATAVVLAVAATVLGVIASFAADVSSLATVPWTALAACAAAGLLHFGAGWTLLGVSQVRLGAARTGIVVGTVPLFGALVAAVALDEPLGLVQVVGLSLTVLGVVVVVGAGRPPGGARTPPPAGSTGARALPADRRVVRAGVAAGLATAACWSLSPILIRLGLRDIDSPLLAAAVGMISCAVVYGAGVVVTGNVRRGPAEPSTRPLLLVSGTAVSLAILLQWTAYDLTTIAVTLAVLQLTPPIVLGLSARVAGDALGAGVRRRAWLGATATLLGSLALVLANA